MVQGLLMYVVGLTMIPLLQKYLGMPYEAALAFCVVAGIGYTMPALLGVSLVPGWITPAIPVVILPLVSFFKPVLPTALSLTLVLTAYICIMVGMEELKNSTEHGVAPR